MGDKNFISLDRYPTAVELSDTEDWTAKEAALNFLTYIGPACRQIQSLPEWNAETPVLVTLNFRYYDFPFILNEKLFKEFGRRFAKFFDKGIGECKSHVFSTFKDRKKCLYINRQFSFYLCSTMKDKIISCIKLFST